MAPHIPRVTLALPVLDHVSRTVALVAGSTKQPAFQKSLTDPRSTLPAALFQPRGGMAWVTFLRD